MKCKKIKPAHFIAPLTIHFSDASLAVADLKFLAEL